MLGKKRAKSKFDPKYIVKLTIKTPGNITYYLVPRSPQFTTQSYTRFYMKFPWPMVGTRARVQLKRGQPWSLVGCIFVSGSVRDSSVARGADSDWSLSSEDKNAPGDRSH